MEDAKTIRTEIEHLRTLLTLIADQKIKAEIEALIQALESYVKKVGNGHS